MTGLSVAVALVVGAIEALGFAAEHLGLAGGFADTVALATDNLGILGVVIVTAFVGSWLVSLALARLRTA
jgi:high-affinity nickel-transport protein